MIFLTGATESDVKLHENIYQTPYIPFLWRFFLLLAFSFCFRNLPEEVLHAKFLFHCRHHHTDGAYFGTGFPHMLFMVHPEYRPKRPANQFVPRLYGFKIHHLAYQIQQQAAANFKAPMRTMSYNNAKR